LAIKTFLTLERKLAGGCTGEDIYVTQAFIPRYECMAALKEYHWDAKGNTYGNLLIRIGEDDYIGGDTFMDHGRACFSLQIPFGLGVQPFHHLGQPKSEW
jgi:hypothetical protein